MQKFLALGRIFNMRYINLSKQKGQGLIETLMIVLFVGISVVALIKFEHLLNYNVSIARQQSDASIVTQNEIETLRDYSVLTTTSGYVAYSGITSGTGTVTVNNTTFTLTWTVTTYTSPTYKTIAVTTTWNDYYGTAHSISMVTNVASLDPSTASTFM